MLENLTGRLQRILKDLRGQGRLTENNIKDGLREIRLALLEADVNLQVARRFIERVREKAMGQEVLTSLTPGQHLVKILRDELQRLLGDGDADLDVTGGPPSVILMVGLQGSGKTSTAAKLGVLLKGRGRAPLLVPADVYRPAATEQLRTLAQQGQISFFEPGPERDPRRICREAMVLARTSGFDTVIADTAGRLHVDDEMMTEVKDLAAILTPHEILYVADAMTGQDAVTSAVAFAGALKLTGVVLTKLDGDARGGAALSIKETTGLPIKLAAVGEKLKDLEVFHPDRMASRIIGMGDVMTLIEKAEEAYDGDDAEEMARALAAGDFSLEDFRDQLRKVKKMGSLGGLLELIPGMSGVSGLRDIDEGALKTTEAVLDSMTPHERLNPSIIGGSRRRRIARGSGTNVQEVNKLLRQYAQMRKMMRTMSRMGRKGAGASRLPFPFRPR
ncbi:MAG TPA: signal recognition particle protein [Candidatus Polarisedimenticolia bacterium]|nr:signal recognition particle protein [Candidatus Polarisedimenticolia bacterium]